MVSYSFYKTAKKIASTKLLTIAVEITTATVADFNDV